MIAAALASSPPPLPGFLNALSGTLQHYGLWAIGLLITLEDFGVPVPGETILIAGAIYAGAGRINIFALSIVAFAAAVFGDNIGFAIGHFGGRALALRFGKYVFLTEERLDKAENFFDRRGAIVITFARFVEGLRQANGIIAGITGMHWLRFIAFNALGAALWVGTWVSVGYFAGQHITTIYNAITRYSLYAAIAAVVLIAAWVVYRLRKHRKSLAAAVQQAAAQPEAPPQPEAAAHHEATAQPAAAAQPEAAGQHETPAQPEAAAQYEAAAGKQSATSEPIDAADGGRTDQNGRDGRADRDGRDGRQGVAPGEDGRQDRAARSGHGLTGPQDSERS
jgi:membrane protein DedA with SNARE-associated domain